MFRPLPMSRFDLPGLNLPLNWMPREISFKGSAVGEGRNLISSALNEADLSEGETALPLMTLREITMMQIMNVLTDKPNWEEKVFDETIAENWKQEAMETEDSDVSEKMMEWVIEELRWKAENFKKTGVVNVYTGDVVKSDVAIPESLKQSLKAAVKRLEDIPAHRKDYHPGSDGKVLDLVHPSLFPLIYGRSRILEDRLVALDKCIQESGSGKVIEVRDEDERKLNVYTGSHQGWQQGAPFSSKFQWLPCEVDISQSTGAKITSYINNLHPQHHAHLYTIIESIIDKTIPLWSRTLGPLIKRDFYKRMEYTLAFELDPDDVAAEDKPPQNPGEHEDDYWDRIQEWDEEYRTAAQPEPDTFAPPEPEPILDLRTDYGSRGLQIIVKLANIELTPDKPDYEGGTWHVEGQLNEHICATALYYYDNENITESHLAFRQQSMTSDAEEQAYPQSVHGWLQEIYGCEVDGPGVQDIGTTTCRENRLLTFPNILQHQVQPFSLLDKSKSGHRKILALFLVDPGIRVISTANVPPQQREWWANEVERVVGGSNKAIDKLSRELRDKIVGDVDDFPVGMEEAKRLRLELMEERKDYSARVGAAFVETTFSLCEH